MKDNIVLIGFIGTGKSTVGKVLAEKLEKRFIDTDDLLEEKTGKSVPKLFKEEGAVRFRELERAVVTEIAERENAVISCGGGVVLDRSNVQKLKKRGVLVLLTASLETILKRIGEEKERPLLQNVHALFSSREEVYKKVADMTVTAESSVNEVVSIIMKGCYEGNGTKK
jgi:shikimate kinase